MQFAVATPGLWIMATVELSVCMEIVVSSRGVSDHRKRQSLQLDCHRLSGLKELCSVQRP